MCLTVAVRGAASNNVKLAIAPHTQANHKDHDADLRRRRGNPAGILRARHTPRTADRSHVRPSLRLLTVHSQCAGAHVINNNVGRNEPTPTQLPRRARRSVHATPPATLGLLLCSAAIEPNPRWMGTASSHTRGVLPL